VTALANLVRLGDLDLLSAELTSADARARLRRLGLDVPEPARLAAPRERLVSAIERRWMVAYERARQRYGRGIAAVRERVCLGCFVTLPTASTPRPGVDEMPGLCASCGRILYRG
jgi:predicted  nucleic acid-binding Zn-ribbon protein